MDCSCARNPGCSSALLPSSPSTAIFRLQSQCGGRMSRRNEAKDSATWHVRARPQSSVMRFDDRTADRQAHPQTARLRGVESLEHALKRPGPMTQPDINSFFESELGFSWVVVLYDSFGHAERRREEYYRALDHSAKVERLMAEQSRSAC